MLLDPLQVAHLQWVAAVPNHLFPASLVMLVEASL
jgi:hypothetical protein